MAKKKDIFPFEMKVRGWVYGGGQGIEYIDKDNGYSTHKLCSFNVPHTFNEEKLMAGSTVSYTQKVAKYEFTFSQSFFILSEFNRYVERIKESRSKHTERWEPAPPPPSHPVAASDTDIEPEEEFMIVDDS